MLYPDNGVAVAPSMRVLMFAASSLLYFTYKNGQCSSMKGCGQLCSKLVVTFRVSVDEYLLHPLKGTLEGTLGKDNVYKFPLNAQHAQALKVSTLFLFSNDNGKRWNVSNLSLKFFHISFI